jgi:hypothetical protein
MYLDADDAAGLSEAEVQIGRGTGDSGTPSPCYGQPAREAVVVQHCPVSTVTVRAEQRVEPQMHTDAHGWEPTQI